MAAQPAAGRKGSGGFFRGERQHDGNVSSDEQDLLQHRDGPEVLPGDHRAHDNARWCPEDKAERQDPGQSSVYENEQKINGATRNHTTGRITKPAYGNVRAGGYSRRAADARRKKGAGCDGFADCGCGI